MSQELTLAGAIHLAAVVPAVAIGVVQLAAPKGTRPHKAAGLGLGAVDGGGRRVVVLDHGTAQGRGLFGDPPALGLGADLP